jgi:hypothetical protein
MTSEFQLGLTDDIYSFLPLDQLLTPNQDIPVDPDWSFKEFSSAVHLGDGTIQGNGFPSAIWRWNHLSLEHRSILRTLCPALSVSCFIRTATGELDVYGDLEFKSFSAIMIWPEEDEDIQPQDVLSLVLRFTHLVEVVE